jgi:non-heme chloroperoxidase
MPFITTRDGTDIFYKDWGPKDAQAIVFSHGWPLSADDWDNQLLFFRSQRFRVIAHDRRGHGRSGQPDFGNDMDTYVADLIELTDHLDLTDAIHVGHSTGGGEVTRYVARAKPGRVAKAVLISAIPPVMVKKDSNPGGTPIEVFDQFRAALCANRSQFYLDVASGPFFNFNLPSHVFSTFNTPAAKPIDALIRNWWRQGMMGGANAGYDCIKVFSETDFTEDLKAIEAPVLVMHSKDDQVVPYADAGPLAAKLLKKSTLKTYGGNMPHGMMTTHPDIINKDLLAFIRGENLGDGASAETPPMRAEP